MDLGVKSNRARAGLEVGASGGGEVPEMPPSVWHECLDAWHCRSPGRTGRRSSSLPAPSHLPPLLHLLL